MSVFIRLTDYKSSEEKKQAFNNPANRYEANPDDFKKIPGSPIAYWVSENIVDAFIKDTPLGNHFDIKAGMSTTDNELFLRHWYEIPNNDFNNKAESRKMAVDSGLRWFPYIKGGSFRKWYGNNDFVVNWYNDGADIRQYIAERPEKQVGGRLVNMEFFFRECVAWSRISSGDFSARFYPYGSIFSDASNGVFGINSKLPLALNLLNSKIVKSVLSAISPTLNFYAGDISKIPTKLNSENSLQDKCFIMSKTDWDSFETSWDFEVLPVISDEYKGGNLEASYGNWREFGKSQTAEMKKLEEENNRIFIDAYGLQDELTPDVPIEQITLTVNPAYRYGKDKTDEEYEELFRTDSMKELISYSIGCMMGRYSLDGKGLIYAHSGNEGFDHSKYIMFPADEDGIIPLTDLEWFPDDATNRFIEFIEKVWGKDTKEQNLKFVADSLSPKRGETPEETIRRYMSANFFKDHMKRYKKRPIYWLFSSGKEKAFEALVYLHRYNESTLSRMRSEYVNPLQTNMKASLARLDKSLEDNSLSSSEQKKLEKEREVLIKKITELRTFDEQLKHYADQRISIDLDDGVKVNYGKFGDLLAEVKNITGGKDDD